jgi:tRNA (cmo5U34)-methyltransferase
MPDPNDSFHDPQAVANYVDGPARNVPGWADMLRMTDLLLSESVPERGSVLVVGAGGGLELKRFAESHPKWLFHGVDPSRQMLSLARSVLGPLSNRVDLQEGFVDEAPDGPFDGATCLLTLHFVDVDGRARMLKDIRNRLRPGAPLITAQLSFPQAKPVREKWLNRYASFVASSGVEAGKAQAAAEAVGERLCVLSPEQDEAMFWAAGFTAIEQFYAGFAFRGWVCTA